MSKYKVGDFVSYDGLDNSVWVVLNVLYCDDGNIYYDINCLFC